jgi:hypothetical protein
MKKILTHLTGIVFVITILIAVACQPHPEQKGQAIALFDSTKVDIFLRAILLEGQVHLLMSDSRNPGCEVIDNLVTVVFPDDTVRWKKAPHSNIRTIIGIRPVGVHSIFSNFLIRNDSLFTLEVPSTAVSDTVKYEIEFTHTFNKDTIIIDPYLRIED